MTQELEVAYVRHGCARDVLRIMINPSAPAAVLMAVAFESLLRIEEPRLRCPYPLPRFYPGTLSPTENLASSEVEILEKFGISVLSCRMGGIRVALLSH